jgi:hypothetical protein
MEWLDVAYTETSRDNIVTPSQKILMLYKWEHRLLSSNITFSVVKRRNNIQIMKFNVSHVSKNYISEMRVTVVWLLNDDALSIQTTQCDAIRRKPKYSEETRPRATWSPQLPRDLTGDLTWVPIMTKNLIKYKNSTATLAHRCKSRGYRTHWQEYRVNFIILLGILY